MSLRIRSLSLHANYRCGHSGACCTAGWPIPVERDTAERLGDAVRSGLLTLTDRDGGTNTEPRPALISIDGAPVETPVATATGGQGACVFYERNRRRCAIHRQLGEALMPDTCRQFPRVSLLDARGLSVTLSHFCPTAANVLFEENDLGVVDAPPAFAGTFPFDPLDARGAWPPLLHPKVLLDLDTFDAWERTMVALLAPGDRGPEEALNQLSDVTESLRRWAPAGTDARDALAQAQAESETQARHREFAGGGVPIDSQRAAAAYELVRRSIPDGMRPAPMDAERVRAADARFVAGAWPSYAAALRRYVAAKIFGSWLAYQGRGLRTIVFGASVALSLVRSHAALECERRTAAMDRAALISAVRRTDELLLHLAARQRLADELSRVEVAGPPPLGLL